MKNDYRVMKNEYRVIRAGLRTDKKRADGLSPIYLFVYSKGTTQKLSLSQYIPEKVWDKEKEVAKAKGYGDINSVILQKKTSLERFIRECELNGREVTRQVISDWWNGKSDNKEVDFYKFYADYCAKHFETIRPATQVHYVTLEKKLKDFSPSLKVTDIDYAFMEAFKKYLKDTRSGVYNMIKFFKTTLREAKKLKLLTDDSWTETKNECPKSKPRFLTMEEVKAIANADLSGYSKSVSVSREFFLFLCYSGLRYSDGQELKKENYNGNLKFTHVKTGTYQDTPVTTDAKKILCKYSVKSQTGGYLFPRINDQTLNDHLKIIAREAKVNKPVSSHYGRHSFASMLHKNKVSAFHIAMLMGHKKINQTFTYVHDTSDGLRDVLKGLSR